MAETYGVSVMVFRIPSWINELLNFILLFWIILSFHSPF